MTATHPILNSKQPKSAVCTLLFFLSLYFGSAGVAMGNQIGKGKTGGVVIKVTAMPLEELLQQIEIEAGFMEFQFPEHMATELITGFVEAPDWSGALTAIFEDMNYVIVWDQRNQLQTVRLIGMKDPQAASLISNPPVANTRTNEDNDGVDLAQAQLREIAKGSNNSPLSEKLYDNLEYRRFMEKYDIHSLEDMKDKDKAMRVRQEARQQLRVLRKRAKQSIRTTAR